MWLMKIKQKLEWIHYYTYVSEGKFYHLQMLITSTNDLGIISDGIQVLYENKKWDLLHELYLCNCTNKELIQSYLVHLYEQKYPILKEQMKCYTEEERVEYEKQLYMMLFHSLSKKESTPSYVSIITDLFLQVASISSLFILSPLILDNYPEKREKFKSALLKNQKFEQPIQSKDLKIVSYIFHMVESIQMKIEQDSTYQPPISKEQIEDLYKKLKTLVLLYNENRVNIFEGKLQDNYFSGDDLESEIMKPENPILAYLNLVAVPNIVKMDFIYKTNCDFEFQTEMYKAFRNQDIEKMTQLDLYYVLYQNPLYSLIDGNKEQISYENIRNKNIEYIEKMKEKLQNNVIQEDDIIGAICSCQELPIFGLFSLISHLPLEDLYSISSNLKLETLIHQQLVTYIEQCKTIQEYDSYTQALDAHYVKTKSQMKN